MKTLSKIFFPIVAAASAALALSPVVKPRSDAQSRSWYHYIKEEMPRPAIPQIRQFKLSNGIQIYFLPASQVPLVHMQVYVEGGGFEAPDDKLGLHGLWGETVVFSGSEKLDRDKLSQYLENRASGFTFHGGAERSAFTLNSMSHYFARDVREMFSVLQSPRLADEDFELLRKRVLQELDRRDENPGKWASLGMTKLFWGDSLRGRYPTTRTVKNVNRADLVQWQQKMWRGERLSIAVTGAIDEAQLKNLLEETFGKLAYDAKSKVNLDVMHVKPSAKANTLSLLPKEIPQTTVIYKAPGMKHTDADYYALRVFDFLLGGDSFNSYLTQKIRTEKGWAYSAYSTFETDDFTGSVMVFTQTANMNLPDVIAAIDDILAKPEAFVSIDKINQAKLALKNKFVFLFENPAQYMKLFLQLKWDGLPESYLPDYVQHLSKVTEADVLRVAKTYYKPERFTVLLCGPQDIYAKKSALRPEVAAELKLEK